MRTNQLRFATLLLFTVMALANNPVFGNNLPADSTVMESYQLETKPNFVGGNQALGQFLSTQLNYPMEAREAAVEGKVYVRAIIDEDGRVLLPEVIRGIGAGCDREVIRIFNAMPKWNPGQRNGRNVPTRIAMAIEFSLTN